MLKILGIAVLVLIALSLFGAIFKFLTAALVIGVIVFLGAAAYAAVRGRSERRALR